VAVALANANDHCLSTDAAAAVLVNVSDCYPPPLPLPVDVDTLDHHAFGVDQTATFWFVMIANLDALITTDSHKVSTCRN
jgi:hypothetical protein